MSHSPRFAVLKRWPGLVVAVVVCQLAGVIGALTTETGSSSWYMALEKPSFQPPGWLFGPVWITLYTMMGVAVWRVARKTPWTPAVRRAVTLFGIQLVLNAVWSPVFFAAHAISVALIILGALWIALLATLILFWRIDRAAGLLLMPFLAWVSFATILNASIVHLNP